jgi:UDP-N-acetylmuramoyl-tripeptide--D-alanyl-D-alanine ligase
MKFFVRKIIIKIIQFQARVIVWRYKPRVIAITGSVGKTGTKDAVYSVLANFFHVRKSVKSFNNEVGIPLTIIGCPTGWRDILKWIRNLIKGFWVMLRPFGRYPKWLVLEIGISKPGDTEELRQWVQPDTVVVSAFGDMPSHVEFFDSKEDVWKEEASIIEALKPSGTLVLNRDDERVYALRSMTKARVVTFGFHPEADIRIENQEINYENNKPVGLRFRIDVEGNSLPVFIEGHVSASVAYYSSAALAVCKTYDVNLVKAIETLTEIQIPRGRARLIDGIHDAVLIDDTYNSSPPALRMALDTLGDMEAHGRKVAVIGDMLELGRFSEEEHQKLGARAVEVCDVLVTVGVRARNYAVAGDKAGFSRQNIHEFDDSESASEFLKKFIREGDVVLVKGSQGVRMERIVKSIMKNPRDAKDLLVRQESAWLENNG